MPVSLDKQPEPRPEDMDRAPAYRVDLRKTTALYFVVADDENIYDPFRWAPGFRPYRDILSVERAATNDVEQAMQRDDIDMALLDSQSPLVFREFYANSAAHAAGLARRDYFEEKAVEAAEDAMHGDNNPYEDAAIWRAILGR
ncbi:hypothetical protein [Streptomyces sp. NPDC046685]|uniref:hypothetical protein n=1 Tax=Streptomyces sp. NPDC046685 TaxID=3157202 RepID=UPI0033D71997